jgi:hypothetical protein
LLLVALGARGEPIDLAASSTWLALLYAVVVSVLISLLPAFLLCVAISAALFWRGSSNQLFQRTASGGR